MAPVSGKKITSQNGSGSSSDEVATTSSSGASAAQAAEYEPIVDLNDPRNFARDRPVRSSRNKVPIYKEPAVSSTSQNIKKVSNRPKRLTARRTQIITDFLREVVARPGKYGNQMAEWKKELLNQLRDPKNIRGNVSFDPVTSADVNDWLQNKKFLAVLKKLEKKGGASGEGAEPQPSTSAAVVVKEEVNQPDENEEVATSSGQPATSSSSHSPGSTETESSPKDGGTPTSFSEGDNEGEMEKNGVAGLLMLRDSLTLNSEAPPPLQPETSDAGNTGSQLDTSSANNTDLGPPTLTYYGIGPRENQAKEEMKEEQDEEVDARSLENLQLIIQDNGGGLPPADLSGGGQLEVMETSNEIIMDFGTAGTAVGVHGLGHLQGEGLNGANSRPIQPLEGERVQGQQPGDVAENGYIVMGPPPAPPQQYPRSPFDPIQAILDMQTHSQEMIRILDNFQQRGYPRTANLQIVSHQLNSLSGMLQYIDHVHAPR